MLVATVIIITIDNDHENWNSRAYPSCHFSYTMHEYPVLVHSLIRDRGPDR